MRSLMSNHDEEPSSKVGETEAEGVVMDPTFFKTRVVTRNLCCPQTFRTSNFTKKDTSTEDKGVVRNPTVFKTQRGFEDS